MTSGSGECAVPAVDQTSVNKPIQVLEELIGRIVLPASVVIEDVRILNDLEMLLCGGFDPLQGFLGLSDYESVLKDMRLSSGEVWAMPIVLPLDLSRLSEGNNYEGENSGGNVLELRDPTGKIIADVLVSSVFRPDIELEQKSILGTTDKNHPFIAYQNGTGFQSMIYVGGTVRKLNSGVERFDFKRYRRQASEVRRDLETIRKGRENFAVVGFQTRNPLHRAHMELTVEAMRDACPRMEGDKKFDVHLMLTPAVGPTQPGDIPAGTRVRCYEAILPYYKTLYGAEFPDMEVQAPTMTLLPIAMRMAGPREAVWHAQIRKNYGCTHFVVGRDHAGPTSKDSNGNAFYGMYEAHELLESVEDKIGIKVCYAKMFGFCGDLGYLPFNKIPEGVKAQNVSGTEIRTLLASGKSLPNFFSFPEVAEELAKYYKAAYKRGLVIYMTGLPCSGKSSLAQILKVWFEAEDANRAVTVLDGDLVRLNLSKGLGFSRADRSLNVRRIGFAAALVAYHSGVAIAANIAPFAEDRKANREAVEQAGANYVEVFVDTPLETCEARDVKGLYRKARTGEIPNFTGISDPYERPEGAEIVIEGELPLTDAMDRIVEYLSQKGFVAVSPVRN